MNINHEADGTPGDDADCDLSEMLPPEDIDFLARAIANQLSLCRRDEFETITARAWEIMEANGMAWEA